jgi:hypothetical protein
LSAAIVEELEPVWVCCGWLILSDNCSICFGRHYHPSSGAHTTVSTASGICHTITAICRCRGRFGTGLSVLWVTYAPEDGW